MAHYLMNGVLVHDYLMSGLPQNPYTFAEHYFATLPAFSIGHHPILIAFALVPFYAVLGMSVVSAKLMIVIFALLAAMSFYNLVKRLYEEDAALLATLLLLTNAFVLKLSMSVMSEIPSFAFLFLATNNFFAYLRDESSNALILFVVFFFIGLLAKQTAIVMLPVYCTCYVATKGWKTVFTRKAVLLTACLAGILVPIAIITLKYSQHNVNWTLEAIRHSLDASRFLELAGRLWGSVLSKPLAALCLVAVPVAFWKGNTQSLRVAGCMLWMFLFFILIHAPYGRHMIFIAPLAAMLGASLIVNFKNKKYKGASALLILTVLICQVAEACNEEVPRTYGYEEAAKYVAANWKGESVLYASSVDTGFFVFFFRKSARHSNRVILRADKLLATSKMHEVIDDRIAAPREIYAILKQFGVCHIVVEDHDLRSKPLNWLRDELHTAPFVLRQRIPLRSNDVRLKNKHLNIYEYLDYTPADPDAILELRIPLVGDKIVLRFGDLIDSSPAGQNPYSN